MIIAFIFIKFDGTKKLPKNAKQTLALLFLPKKCHEVSKNAKFAGFGTKYAKLATMLAHWSESFSLSLLLLLTHFDASLPYA